jgi:hypothetical protein
VTRAEGKRDGGKGRAGMTVTHRCGNTPWGVRCVGGVGGGRGMVQGLRAQFVLLRTTIIVGRGLRAFASSHRLHTVSLANCRRLTDEAVIHVSHLMSIENLTLDGSRCITDRSLAAISNLCGLQKLDLSQCDLITDEGLEHLETLEVLEELSLGWCRMISDRGVNISTRQPGRSLLRVLRLARCPISDEGIAYVARLQSLTALDINGCSNIGSAALGNTLEALSNLEHLDVSYRPGIL